MLRFNALSWYTNDHIVNEMDGRRKLPNQFEIEIFGRDEESRSVHVKVMKFRPYFYILLPHKLEDENLVSFLEFLVKMLLPWNLRVDVCIPECEQVFRTEFYGHQFSRQKCFLKLVFTSETARRSMASSLLRTEVDCDGIFDFLAGESTLMHFRLFENNLDPILRFFHERHLNPSGWIQIEEKNLFKASKGESACDVCVYVSCHAIVASEKEETAAFTVLSFDIEANSSHGDFPQAKKTYTKFSKEIVDSAIRCRSRRLDCVDRIDTWMQQAFNKDFKTMANQEISYVFTKQKVEQCLIVKLKHFLHKLLSKLPDVSAMNKTDVKNLRESLNNRIERKIRKMNVMTSESERLKFPEVEGDNITQIGSVLWRYGEKRPYLRHITTLGGCRIAGSEDICIEACVSEADVLMKWRDLLRNEKPDVIVGYNTMGFDYKFMWERAEELKILHKFNRMSKRLDHACMLREKSLVSSGLGENLLYYIDIPGVVPIDLLKVVMRDHRLASYKLDDVASHFINGKVENVTCICDDSGTGTGTGSVYSNISTDNVYALNIGDYVTFQNSKSLLNDAVCDGEKFEIVDVDTNEFRVRGRVDLGESQGIKWGLKKDDVSVNDIFRLQNEGDYERGIIAKYCIQDCMLCSNLLLKLDILANNIGMSRVCFTPLEYIFLRGQGVKTYSLVSYQCLQEDYLIPLQRKISTKKKNVFVKSDGDFGDFDDEDDDEDDAGDGEYGEDGMTDEDWYESSDNEEAKKSGEEGTGDEKDAESSSDESEVSRGSAKSSSSASAKREKVSTIQNKAAAAAKARTPPQQQKSLSFGQGLGQQSGDKARSEKKKKIEDEEEEIITDRYEGACVLTPAPKIYIEDHQCITTLDFSSLYPSVMISCNLSHCSIVLENEYLGESGGEKLRALGYDFKDISYDNYVYRRKGKTVHKELNAEMPLRTCRFLQPKKDEGGNIIDSTRGVIPRTLMKLLASRKSTRKKMQTETDPFKLAVLEGLQLAYKVTANSLYGSIGAGVNAIYFKDIAACTTAGGRTHLFMAQKFVLENYPKSRVVYGDTDSIFVMFHLVDENGEYLKGKAALTRSIELGKEASRAFQRYLEPPHCLEYEKTFFPFILFSKKKYVGNKYEDMPDKCKLTSMGIVMKRRDNAPILKHVYGMILDCILNKHDLRLAERTLLEQLRLIVRGDSFPIEYFVISKCLRSSYANPEGVVHKVLADRITDRGSGKPMPNDRIRYVYIDVGKKKVKLQGERVEDPDFIRENKLKIDYVYYIEKQLMKPISQIFALVVESLSRYRRPKNYFALLEERMQREVKDPDKLRKQMEDQRMAEVRTILFDEIMQTQRMKRSGQRDMRDFVSIEDFCF